MSHFVHFSIDKNLGRIDLVNPDHRNALSFELLEDLGSVLADASMEKHLSVCLLTAKGPAFSAGMDLKSVDLASPQEAKRFADLLGDIYRKLLDFPVPLFCAVDGPALGGAVGIVLACDLIWMGPMGKLGLPETRIGVVPALVSVVARERLSEGKLVSLALTGASLDAQKCVNLGLVDYQARADATAEAEAFARKTLFENSSEAMSRTKRFLRSKTLSRFEKDIEEAKGEFLEAVSSKSAKRGLAAFGERKSVDWSEADV